MQVSNNVKVGGMVFGGTLVGALIGYGVRHFVAKKQVDNLAEQAAEALDAAHDRQVAAEAEHAKAMASVMESEADYKDRVRGLVEEKKAAFKRVDDAQAKLAEVESQVGPLRVRISELGNALTQADKEAYARGLKDGTAAALAPDPEPLVGKKAHKRQAPAPVAEPEALPEAG